MPEKMSRREFFKTLTPSKKEKKPEQDHTTPPSETPIQPQKPQHEEPSKISEQQERQTEAPSEDLMKRREVLKIIAGASAGLTALYYLPISNGEKNEKPPLQDMTEQERKKALGALLKETKEKQKLKELRKSKTFNSAFQLRMKALEENIQKNPDYVRSMIETSLMNMAEGIASEVARYLNIPSGGGYAQSEEFAEKLKNFSWKDFFRGTVVAGLVEEAIFRLQPSIELDTEQLQQQDDPNYRERYWGRGVYEAGVFAIAHNFYFENGKLRFAKTVPIEQFIAGIYFWYVMRERGFSHAAFSHAFNNTLCFDIAELLRKQLPKKTEQEENQQSNEHQPAPQERVEEQTES